MRDRQQGQQTPSETAGIGRVARSLMVSHFVWGPPEPGVLEDDRRLDMCHLGLCREGAHGDVTEVVGVTDDDMDEKVVVTRHVIEGDNLRKLFCVLAETRNLSGLMTVEPHRDHGLKADAEDSRVDVCVKTTEYPLVLETADSLRAG